MELDDWGTTSAPAALAQLDKGLCTRPHVADGRVRLTSCAALQSPSPGVVCEAVLRYPRLFARHPFGYIVNAGALRLAELFRTGDNFVRRQVAESLAQCVAVHDKIVSVHEFARRVLAVTLSNDAVGRSLALHVLGGCARILSTRREVHHVVQTRLALAVGRERDAALFAADCLCAVSPAFAATLLAGPLPVLVEDPGTPPATMLRLVRLMRHFHGEPAVSRAALVWGLALFDRGVGATVSAALLQAISTLVARSLV
jgi:hypothetical protein